jgi:hypothetical protein
MKKPLKPKPENGTETEYMHDTSSEAFRRVDESNVREKLIREKAERESRG